MNDFSYSPKGWECPKCGRVYSPTTPMCMHCPQQVTSGTTINTPIINATGTYSYHNFVSDNRGTASRCMICGLESWQHSVVTNT